jgi:hypothetical protein
MRCSFRLFCLSTVVSVLTIGLSPLHAGKPDRSVDDWLSVVSRQYAEEGWAEKPRSRSQRYLRPADDKGWQTRMRALQAVVSTGQPSIRPLLNALESGDDSLRIFAAQALGYLGSSVPVEPLLRAAREDKVAAVRLYAVDSLGMRGDAAKTVPWESLRKREKNPDVRKHIGYAIERKNTPVEKKVVQTLTAWNLQTMNTAIVGKPAPDFELTSAGGRAIRLSSFRGKKAVVLVFIYGDT